MTLFCNISPYFQVGSYLFQKKMNYLKIKKVIVFAAFVVVVVVVVGCLHLID